MVSTCSFEELRTQPGMVIEKVCSSKEPVYIRQGDTASVVMLDADEYLTQMQALNEFKRIYTSEEN